MLVGHLKNYFYDVQIDEPNCLQTKNCLYLIDRNKFMLILKLLNCSLKCAYKKGKLIDYF